MLTKNRLKNQIIFLSSKPMNIVAALMQGYQTIPIIQYDEHKKDDFQLNLIEHFFLKIKHLDDQ